MKAFVFISCLALLALAFYTGCKKELSLELRSPVDSIDTTGGSQPVDTTQDSLNYQPTSAGSYWYYYPSNNPNQLFLSVISSNRDTSFHGHNYHIFTFNFGGSSPEGYMRREGNAYYAAGGLFSAASFVSSVSGSLPQPLLDSLQYAEVLYLRSDLPDGSSWTQTQDFTYQSANVNVELKLNFNFAIQSHTANMLLQGQVFSKVITEEMTVNAQVLVNGVTLYNQSYTSTLLVANKVGIISFTSLDGTGQEIDLYTYQIN
ncbi:hypothetical protein [Thermoflavifilum thermophilum]|uniref:Uncharacterized protein n=1 Tax=Thermoflavifilum thermophilum TaxID=1393122 RepID=A0A1I7NAF9_9BACT|nr:hypothetical protein [Thermoflavifilum thermophilum]SFV31639.1 hypothetical protein SAMN05660895_1133 [Thermoflavifilum thermophilum]